MSKENYVPPAWAIEAAAAAPRISPADAAPLIAIFRDTQAERIARAAMSPAVQALVDQAPPLTRAQIGTIRTAMGYGGLPADGGSPAVRAIAAPPRAELHYLYRYRDACGCLLYVGITNDLDKRDASHTRDSAWYEFVASRETSELPSLADAMAAERTAIGSESPAFNVVGRKTNAGQALAIEYLRRHANGPVSTL